MQPFFFRCLAAASLITSLNTSLQAASFSSDIRATDTLELYTSEGCNSCPPADRWFTSLKQDDRLFKDFIPLAFHVDYWNYLDWEDRFSAPGHSDRQRRHVKAGNVSQSYTPQVVLNNEEWRGHLRGIRNWEDGERKAGILSAELSSDQQLTVKFAPVPAIHFQQEQWVLNIAYLGMGLKTAVQRGENAGRELQHDFVVLTHQSQPVESKTRQWQIAIPPSPPAGQQRTALVVWLSEPQTQRTLQAVGGFL